jgi:PAS domain-containing protein
VERERDTLSALVESVTDEIWFADADGNVTLVNPAVWQEFGSLGGEPIAAIAARFEVYRADGTPRPPAEAPPLRALHGETIKDEEEIVRTPATGELRHRLVSGAPVRDRDGAIIGSVCVVRDVTDRVRAEEALHDSEERLRSATAAAGSGAFDWNMRTGVNRWTEEWEAM